MVKRREDSLLAFDLRAVREREKLSQAALAEVLNVSQGTISKWEDAGQVPPIYRKYLALYLKVKRTFPANEKG